MARGTLGIGFHINEFYDDLVRHQLIVPVGVHGAFARTALFENVLQRVDSLLEMLAKDDGADAYTFPPIINRKVLEKVHYFNSFPHLCGSVYSFLSGEAQAREMSNRIAAGTKWDDLLGMTDVALNPAACYPLYPTLTGTLPAGGRYVTMLNWVFRHEPSPEPTRMQSFRVREFVALGIADQVSDWRKMWLQRATALMDSLRLPAAVDAVSDPFFGSGHESLIATQKTRCLKLELSVPILSPEHPTALCSFNLHQAYFGMAFDIRSHDGKLANSACVGFGLERIVMALFRIHGFTIAAWPSTLRSRLWP